MARAKAYEALAAKYPDDDEAQIFYAVYLAGTQLQSDQTYAAYLKSAAILEQQFKKHPQHPGVAHYLIHSYDAPPIAQRGIPASRRYAEIAPDAPHALHMPSHIFTRVGEWTDSIATNLRSAASATNAKEPDQAAHALDYAAYAYLQLARDSEARKVTDEVLGYKGFNQNIFTGSYAAAAMPARYALERADWRAAAQLDALRARPRRGAQRRRGRGAEGRRAHRRPGRAAEGSEKRLLGGRGRGDAPCRQRMGRARARK